MSGIIHFNESARRELAAAVEDTMNDALDLIGAHDNVGGYAALARDLVIIHTSLVEPRLIVDGPVSRAKAHRRPYRRSFK